MNRFKTPKKLFSVLTVFTLLFVLSITAFAKNPSIVDSAGLFTESQKASLEEKIQETISLTGVDIVIVTTNDTQGKTSEAYSDDYFDYNGYGLGEERNGILFLINMGDREMHISQRGSGTNFFDDASVETAFDVITPYASAGEYGQAAETLLTYVQSRYNASVNPDAEYEFTEWYQGAEETQNVQGSIGAQESEKESEPPDPALVSVIAVVVGLIAGCIACLLVASKYKMKLGGYQYPFRAKSSVHMTVKTDTLVDRHITQQRINNDSDRRYDDDDNDDHNHNNNHHNRPFGGGGGGGRINISLGSGGTSHTSSSGASHRGSTRGF